MKYFIIVFIFIFCEISQAQPFESIFGKDSTKWNVIVEIPDYAYTATYKVQQDTFIAGNSYKQITEFDFFSENVAVIGCLREDSIHGKY